MFENCTFEKKKTIQARKFPSGRDRSFDFTPLAWFSLIILHHPETYPFLFTYIYLFIFTFYYFYYYLFYYIYFFQDFSNCLSHLTDSLIILLYYGFEIKFFLSKKWRRLHNVTLYFLFKFWKMKISV